MTLPDLTWTDPAGGALAQSGVASPDGSAALVHYPAGLAGSATDELLLGAAFPPAGWGVHLGLRRRLDARGGMPGSPGRLGTLGTGLAVENWPGPQLPPLAGAAGRPPIRALSTSLAYAHELPVGVKGGLSLLFARGSESGVSGSALTGAIHAIWRTGGVLSVGLALNGAPLVRSGGASRAGVETAAGVSLALRPQRIRLAVDLHRAAGARLPEVRIGLAAEPTRTLRVEAGFGRGAGLGIGAGWVHHPFRFDYAFTLGAVGGDNVHRLGVRMRLARSLEELLSRLYDAADRLERDGEVQEAVPIWQRLLDMDAGFRDATARLALAEEHARLSEQERASLVATRLRAGEATESRGDRLAALGWFEAALAVEPRNARAAAGRARILDHFKRAVESDFTAAVSAYESGRFPEAVAGFQRVLFAFPRHELAPAYLLIARQALEGRLSEMLRSADAALANEDHKEAMAGYQAALALSPSSVAAAEGLRRADGLYRREVERQLALAEGRLEERDFPASIEAYQGVLRLDPGNAAAASGLSRARNGARLLPDPERAALTGRLMQQARFFRREGKRAEALAALARGLGLFPRDAEALALKAEIVSELGRDAFASMRQGALAQARFLFSLALAADPSREDARAGISEADERRATGAELHRRAADGYNAGQIERALSLWRESVAADPENADARAGLTAALLFLGIREYRADRLPEAVAWWEEAMRVTPGHVLAERYVARARRKAATLAAGEAAAP